MILRKIVLEKFGAFASPIELDFESDITVLTGANDTGKTTLLRFLRIFSDNATLEQEEINNEYFNSSNQSWDVDSDLTCEAHFEVTEWSKNFISSLPLQAGDIIVTQLRYAPRINEHRILSVRRNGQITSQQVISARPLTNIHYLHNAFYDDSIKSVIDLSSLHPSEQMLLSVAFGNNINIQKKLKELKQPKLNQFLETGTRKINEKLQKIIPPSLKLKVRFSALTEIPEKIGFFVTDDFDTDTPFNRRGSGFRKILHLMIQLLTIEQQNKLTLIVLDEPEIGLHPDAQHSFRLFLERLGTSPYFQVIYSTHSPAMINSTKPHTVRLLRRAVKNEVGTSIVINRPIDGNYGLVRSSLGITPADSLLYAPITLIVEGPTDVLALPYLLKKLEESEIPGFQDSTKLLSLSHFLEGQGNSFEYWTRLAQSQGAKPIIFVDGDKVRQIKQLKIHDKYPEIPVIHLPEGIEYEEVFPIALYFEALHKLYPLQKTQREFEEWVEKQTRPRMFSKHLDKWLEEENDMDNYDKPKVMKKVVEIADPSQLKPEALEVFKQLVNHMRDIAKTL